MRTLASYQSGLGWISAPGIIHCMWVDFVLGELLSSLHKNQPSKVWSDFNLDEVYNKLLKGAYKPTVRTGMVLAF